MRTYIQEIKDIIMSDYALGVKIDAECKINGQPASISYRGVRCSKGLGESINLRMMVTDLKYSALMHYLTDSDLFFWRNIK